VLLYAQLQPLLKLITRKVWQALNNPKKHVVVQAALQYELPLEKYSEWSLEQ
jgi:hypothetical protein